jgi:hypothetical protein
MVAKRALRKVKNKGLDTISKISANIFDTKITDAEFLRKTWSPKYKFEDLEGLKKHFRERKKPNLFIDSSKRKDIISSLCEHFAYTPEKTIAEADKICAHIFDLLGSGPVKVYYGMKGKGFEGYCYNTQINRKKLTTIHHSSITTDNYEPIDWHIDSKSGYRWNPKTYYKDIKYGHRLGVDVKVPWELSRFQHLTTLGKAYFISNNEKYVKEFVNEINDWIEHNPPKFGVNWACTMDVAIRVCNYLLAWEFFKNSPLIGNGFIIKFFKNLLQHGRHIKNNLEWSETLTSNHYLSDIVGLVYLGVLTPEFKESKKWKNFGIEELKKEMKKQICLDGVDFEASTCYHRLALELFFYTTFLVIINDKNFKEDNFIEIGNEIFGKEYLRRLYKMFEFLLYALKPNGRMPQIGDNDNGRFHIFANREVLDMRYLLTLGAIFFKEPEFKIKEFGFCEEALWVFGEKGYKIWQDLEQNCLANIGSWAFLDAGWYIMRNDKNYIIISCGPDGQNGNSGHCHNDKLSFELCMDGKDIIVDAGTYIYTAESEWRNRFRSTAYHNTVVVDNREQNSFNPKELFSMGNEAEIRVNEWKITNEYDFLDAEHSGYERLSNPLTHRRQILFNKKEGYWVIRDILTGSKKHTFDFHLHFASMKIESIPQDPLSLVSNCQDANINLLVLPLETEDLKFLIENNWISYSYGTKVLAPVIKYSRVTYTPTTFVIALYPFKGSQTSRPIGEIKERILIFLRQNSDKFIIE